MLTGDSWHEMARLFAAPWRKVLLRGTVAIAFGVLTFVWPGVTAATLVPPRFGFLALADGIFLLLTAIAGHRQRQDRRLLLLEGIVENLGWGCDSAGSNTCSPSARPLRFDLGHGNRLLANCSDCPPAENRFRQRFG